MKIVQMRTMILGRIVKMQYLSGLRRTMGTIDPKSRDILKEKVASKIPIRMQEVGEFTKHHGNEVVEKITVDMVYKGMRDIKALVKETSYLDANEAIRYRGHSLNDLSKLLPTAMNGTCPLAEAVYWLLLTGEVPTHDEVQWLKKEWQRRCTLPDYVKKIIDSFPEELHPMAKFSASVTAMHHDSVFEKEYHLGIKKENYWQPIYEDAMNLLARLPALVAMIYNHSYNGNVQSTIRIDQNTDFTSRFCQLVSLNDEKAIDFMRLYFFVHADYDGGNVSAHTCHLVGSALSDPYLSFGAALNGLAGPLHGSEFEKYVNDTSRSDQLTPECGHAVIRMADPRYSLLFNYGANHFPDDKRFRATCMLMDMTLPLFEDDAGPKNPCPNVDAISGSCFWHYGFLFLNFYTVLLGVSRCLGTMASLIWDRALQAPLERPKSLPTAMFKALVDAK